MRERKLAEKMYLKLLRLYPRDFRERFGREMEQNFADLSREREVRFEFKWLRVAWLFGDAIVNAGRENMTALKRESIANPSGPGPRTALIAAVLLALPMAIILPVSILNIEPLNGFFAAQMNDMEGPGHAVGILTILTAMVSLPLGGMIALMPVVGASRSGVGVLAYRYNLVLGAMFLAVGVGLWAMLLLDGLSCAMGMSACD